jgi:hypothetical protein
LLFRGTPIEQDEPKLSASFYAERNPADQAQPHPYESFVFGDYQSLVTFDIKPDPVGPIMTSIPMVKTQVVADKAKESLRNKRDRFFDGITDKEMLRNIKHNCISSSHMSTRRRRV